MRVSLLPKHYGIDFYTSEKSQNFSRRCGFFQRDLNKLIFITSNIESLEDERCWIQLIWTNNQHIDLQESSLLPKHNNIFSSEFENVNLSFYKIASSESVDLIKMFFDSTSTNWSSRVFITSHLCKRSPNLVFRILKRKKMYFFLFLLPNYVFIDINFIYLQIFLPVSLVTEFFPPILCTFYMLTNNSFQFMFWK